MAGNPEYRWRRAAAVAAGAIIILAPAGCEQRAVEQQVYAWLQAQQAPTGILGNQDGDDFAGVYPNALAAICFVHQGDRNRAERIFRFYQEHFDDEFADGKPKGFHQFWDARTGRVHADSDRWVGDNAWLLIALNYYRQQANRSDFDAMRRGIAEWIISLQDAAGGIMSGSNKSGPMKHKSTEANLDCVAALADYPRERAKIRGWLRAKMWVAGEKRFRMGSTVDETPLDSIAWGIGALGKEWAETLDYAEKKFLRTDVSEVTSNTVTGFADFIGKKRI